MLMMRARRAREARAVAPAASGTAAALSTATGSSSRAQRQPDVRIPPPASSADAPALVRLPAQAPPASNAPSSAPLALEGAPTAASPHKGPAVTKARRAADALANGSYAEALRLYDELRAEEPRAADGAVASGQQTSAAAFEQASRILRARLEQSSVATP
jgi:hypothetical protein